MFSLQSLCREKKMRAKVRLGGRNEAGRGAEERRRGAGRKHRGRTCAGWRLGKIRMKEGMKEGRKEAFHKRALMVCRVPTAPSHCRFPDASYGGVSSGCKSDGRCSFFTFNRTKMCNYKQQIQGKNPQLQNNGSVFADSREATPSLTHPPSAARPALKTGGNIKS